MVIATIKAQPNDVASLAQNAELDVFNLTDANTRPLALRLANRIEDVLRGKGVPSFSGTTDSLATSSPASQVTLSIAQNEDDSGLNEFSTTEAGQTETGQTSAGQTEFTTLEVSSDPG